MAAARDSEDYDRNAADRHAIRELIDAWAHHADRRDPVAQADLFVEEGRVLVCADGLEEPTQRLTGRAELVEAFGVLNTFDKTTHFNGQTTLVTDGDHAHGESYCLAHHLWNDDGIRTLLVMSIRYLDQFVRKDGEWYFLERRLIVDWQDRRPSAV